MRTARLSIPVAWLVLGLLFASPAAGQFERSAEDLYVAQEVTITLPVPADTLFVTYRPGSTIPIREAVPVADQQTVAWTPRYPGVVALATADGTAQNVSVRFQSIPGDGVLVLVLAGCILFGGIAFSFRKLFS